MLHVKRSCLKHESLNDVWSSSSVNMELEKKNKNAINDNKTRSTI